jgi:hypothetical protein
MLQEVSLGFKDGNPNFIRLTYPPRPDDEPSLESRFVATVCPVFTQMNWPELRVLELREWPKSRARGSCWKLLFPVLLSVQAKQTDKRALGSRGRGQVLVGVYTQRIPHFDVRIAPVLLWDAKGTRKIAIHVSWHTV